MKEVKGEAERKFPKQEHIMKSFNLTRNGTESFIMQFKEDTSDTWHNKRVEVNQWQFVQQDCGASNTKRAY